MEFLCALVAETREHRRTAVLSSHIVGDIQQACDRLVILADGRVLLNMAVEQAQVEHRTTMAGSYPGVVGEFTGPDGRLRQVLHSSDPQLPRASLEDIVLAYLASERSAADV